MLRLRTRTVWWSVLVIALVAAVAWAATEVTVTKTSSTYASAVYFEPGNMYVGATLQETNNGWYLNYYVYDYTTYSYIERGYGEIPANDVTWTSSGISLDTNTEDIAIIGDGGDIELDWAYAPDNYQERSQKTTYTYLNMKQISFSDREMASAVAEGTFLGEDFAGTGQITSLKGKVILQVK